MYYPACSLQYNNRPCNKKLSNNSGDGQNWWCDRCQQESRPDWRYILTVKADDHTGGMYLTAFQVGRLRRCCCCGSSGKRPCVGLLFLPQRPFWSGGLGVSCLWPAGGWHTDHGNACL